jgi:hypothetical protein
VSLHRPWAYHEFFSDFLIGEFLADATSYLLFSAGESSRLPLVSLSEALEQGGRHHFRKVIINVSFG